MGLFSPWFLAGLAALALPLWLHLLRQFKRTPRPFSSLMFFERRVQSSTRHRRLRYLALLAMRLALLALLALAFANPFVNRTSASVKQRTVTLIALDRSFSMRYRNHLDDAKAEAHRLVNALHGQEQAQVAALDSRLETLTQPERDKAVLNAAIDSIEPGDQASSYGEFSRALRVMAETAGVHLDAHLITDDQQTSMPASFNDLQIGPHASLVVHCVGDTSSPNWAVESVTAPAHVYDPTRTRLTATVAGWQGPAVTRKVLLVLDGRTLASKDTPVPQGGRAQVEFNGFDVPYGSHRGEVRIEPHDDLPGDDSFGFSIERSDPRKVLFLYAAGRAQDAFYYESAMRASNATGLTVETSPLERESGRDLSKYAFAVLENPGALDASAKQQLAEYVSRGGSVLIAVGPSTTRAGTIPLAGNAVTATAQTQGARKVDGQAPALAGLEEFQNVQFAATPRIAVNPNDRVLARFADGSPLLIEQRRDEGRILIFASTLDNSTSDFPLHASFLPFVVQTGAYLSGADDALSSVAVGTPVRLRQTNAQATAADVIGPDGKHQLSLAEATRAMSYDVDRAGFYEVQPANGHRELVAVNADRRESDLTQIPAETLSLWRNTGRSTDQPGTLTENPETGQQTVRWSLWRYFLALVLIAAIIESVFSSRYLRRERQTS
ncbi:MAG: VWA domain-containing protein [Acidobacteriota bacterium]|nr:VWA domain-containing protein [Acidobacteriota bacterium]